MSAGDAPASLVVGDTGDGTFNASGSSTISSQQTVLGNAEDSMGTVTLDNSNWTNSSFFSVGASGTGDLTVTDKATLDSQDVFYIGLNEGGEGTVTVSDGGSITTETTGIDGTSSTVIGTVADSMGTLNVEGTDSEFESKGAMSIGYGGTGEVTVSAGGNLTVDASIIRVGRNEDSEGTLTVTGTDSSLNVQYGTIYIGYGGTGTVNIKDDATLTVMATNIGGEATGVGTLTIDGEKTMASLGDTIVGDSGDGELDINGGATVEAGDVTIGGEDAVSAAASVMGDQTTLTVDGDLKVGDASNGSLDVDAQGSVTADTLTVGGSAVGTLTLDGDASLTTNDDGTVGDDDDGDGQILVGVDGKADLEIGGDFTVGGSGTGTVIINAGSTLTIDGGSFTIGDEDSGTGTVTINGGTLSFGGKLVIGSDGNGALNFNEGATNDLGGTSLAEPEVTLGENPTGTGTLTLDGSGTQFQTGSVTVGDQGTGTLTISDQAALDATGEVKVSDQLSSNISSITVETSGTLSTTDDITVGGGAIGTMEIKTGGSATAIGDITLGDDRTGTGIVTVDGSQQTVGPEAGSHSSLGFGGTLMVGNYGEGTLEVTDGGYVAPTPTGTGEVDIAAQDVGTSVGNVSVSGSDSKSHAASELDATNLAVGGTMKASGGTGTLTVGVDGVVKVKQTLQTWSKGTVDVGGGGSVTVGTGAAAVAGSVQIDTGGTLGGGGTIDGNVVNSGGTVAPGDPMTLTINGNYTQTGGVLEFQIGGTGPGEFDSIVATGNIFISGATIDLDFIDGFAPTAGETFNFLSSANTSATGLTFNISGLAPGFDFDTTSNSTGSDFVLTAVNNGIPTTPEPAPIALIALSLTILVWRRTKMLESRHPLHTFL